MDRDANRFCAEGCGDMTGRAWCEHEWAAIVYELELRAEAMKEGLALDADEDAPRGEWGADGEVA